MADVAIVPAEMAHVRAMAPRLRERDLAEVHALTDMPAEEAIAFSLRRATHAWAALIGGEVACIWACCPRSLVSGHGAPWLMSTDLVQQNPMRFMRESRLFVKRLLGTYSHLENYVDSRYDAAVSWVRWMGFTIEEPEPMGRFGVPFHRIWKVRDGS